MLETELPDRSTAADAVEQDDLGLTDSGVGGEALTGQVDPISLHRNGDGFVVGPTGAMGTAEALKPCPETATIETFIAEAPHWVHI